MPRLAPRQRQICMLLAEDKLNKEIADLLGLTLGTVKQYICAMQKATGRRRTGLAVLGYILQCQQSQENQPQ